MQWESGRTRRTLLQVVRESKAKGKTTSGVLSRAYPSIFCTHRTRPILLCQASAARTRTYKPSVNALGQQASVQTLMLMVVGLRFVPARHTRHQQISGGWPSATFVFY